MCNNKNFTSVGVLLISTWKYNIFIDNLVSSIKRYFFNDHEVRIFLHTDSDHKYDVDQIIKIKHKSWPYITLNRFNFFIDNQSKYNVDYLFYLDIDSIVTKSINDKTILSYPICVVEHCGWRNTIGTPEKNKLSTAYISHNNNIDKNYKYVAGGFFGGKKQDFLDMCRILKNNIDIDMVNNIIALWHDESHLNKYVINHLDKVKILPYKYMYISSKYHDNINNFNIIALKKLFNKYVKN